MFPYTIGVKDKFPHWSRYSTEKGSLRSSLVSLWRFPLLHKTSHPVPWLTAILPSWLPTLPLPSSPAAWPKVSWACSWLVARAGVSLSPEEGGFSLQGSC